MEYGISYRATSVPVDFIEGQEGLQKITEFDEINAITIRALLKGYKCTDDMLDRLEYESSIVGIKNTNVEFFITYNPHTFAACLTNTTKNLHISMGNDILEQSEILDLVESLPGSLKRPGIYQCLKRVQHEENKVKLQKISYDYPIYDIALRYLCLIKCTESVGSIMSEKYYLVLYLPNENKSLH